MDDSWTQGLKGLAKCTVCDSLPFPQTSGSQHRENCNEAIKILFFFQALKISAICHGAKWHGSWTSVPTIVFKKCSWILTDLRVIVSSWLKTIGLCLPWDTGVPQPPSVYLCWASLVPQVEHARAEPREHTAACLSFSPSCSSAAQTLYLNKCIK